LSRGSVRRNPSFSKSKYINVIRINQVINSSVVKRISESPDVQSTHIKRTEGRETGPVLDRTSPESRIRREMTMLPVSRQGGKEQ
jgi:hypothetical protein